ncbi:hypothetical protein JXE04_01850 [Patescibacteria group bacterium]|nr:hypothetical protein [Patescibacteria group bacterium]
MLNFLDKLLNVKSGQNFKIVRGLLFWFIVIFMIFSGLSRNGNPIDAAGGAIAGAIVGFVVSLIITFFYGMNNHESKN